MSTPYSYKEGKHRQLDPPVLLYVPVYAGPHRLPNSGNGGHPLGFNRRHVRQHNLPHRFGVGKGRGAAQSNILHYALEGVPHRQYANPYLSGGNIYNVGDAAYLVEEIVMAQDNALGLSGCPGGKYNGCRIVLSPLLYLFFYKIRLTRQDLRSHLYYFRICGDLNFSRLRPLKIRVQNNKTFKVGNLLVYGIYLL